ncbi:type II toxin-antitoxin system VapB family antitoxin [Neorhizobium sp. DT-125]|uniref:type II toxin-antitoxin system VapB family antitoxin n=1 Tax=Neorhizobium sp. DT-125 TaxID=3396163 RepID=UPI003F1BBD6E
MALHITDPKLDELAEQAQKILNAPTKTDAIRQALERVVEKEPAEVEKAPKRPLRERLDQLRKEFNLPPYESLERFDEKAFLDEMWGENDVHR